MKKTSKFWKLFKKDNNPQKVKDTIENPFQSEPDFADVENAEKGNRPDTKEEQANIGKARIYNLIIVDESGSMSHLRESTLSGINETISTIRSAQKEFAATQKHTLTLVTFDSGSNRPDVRTMIDNQPIAEVKEFKDYMPNGCTPLYDAMGQSLTRLHLCIKNDKDATAVVTVLTDGLENASRKWNAAELRCLIEQLKSEGWSFAYMGSAHNVKEVTDLLSIENVVEFSHDDRGARNTWECERSSRFAYYERCIVCTRQTGRCRERKCWRASVDTQRSTMGQGYPMIVLIILTKMKSSCSEAIQAAITTEERQPMRCANSAPFGAKEKDCKAKAMPSRPRKAL